MANKTDGNHAPSPPPGNLTLEGKDVGTKEHKWWPNKKNWKVAEIVGADWFHKLGKFTRMIRVMDKPNDQYDEEFVDPDTGEVIWEAHEKLSAHQGHGSAKKIKDD